MTSTKHHLCEYCGTTFAKKRKWYEHELICELIHKINTNEQEEEEEEPITTEIVYEVLKKMVKKQQSMEKEIKELKKHITIKINMIDWLNENIKPTLSLIDFLETITKIESKDIEYLLHHSIHDCLKNILEKNIANYEIKNPTKYNWSIFTYNDKIYFYHYNIQKWTEDNKIENTIWNKINDRLFQHLIEWKEIHILSSNISNDDLENIFNNTLLQLVDKKKEEHCMKFIKQILLQKIKTNITTTSYQIT